jgi:hypothetical protein
MKKNLDWSISLLLGVAILAGCGGDDITLAPDGGSGPGSDGAAKKDGAADGSAKDVVNDLSVDGLSEAAHDAGPMPQRVLVTTNNTTTSELVAVNVATRAVDGRLTFPGSFGTTDAHSRLFPFLLEQANSVVGRLDAVYPWRLDSSWNVLLHDGTDGGFPDADPVAVIVGPPGKAYVLRYDRNEIAVIDPTSSLDAGGLVGTIDLSKLVQKNDADGLVEMTSGVYVASKNMLYVVLENINEYAVSPDGVYDYCSGTVSTVVGIDTKTDLLADLGGAGPGGSLVLLGFNPVPGGLAYDPLGDRILLFEEGCYATPVGDAGAGARSLGGVEQVSLADLSSTVLLNISKDFPPGSGYPSGIVYISKVEAVLGFDFTGSEVYHWNPSVKKLGMPIPNAPDSFTYDGAGNLLGTVTTYGDAGSSTSVVSVAIGTGDSTTLTVDPFSVKGGYIGGVDVWPHP